MASRRPSRRATTARTGALLLLAALGVAGLGDGCHSAAADAAAIEDRGQRQRIAVWSNQGLGQALRAMELNIRDFHAAQRRYAADLTLVPEGVYTETLRIAGASGDLPCLLFLDGPMVPHFAWLGYLQPLDRFLPADLRTDLLPSVVAQGTFNGRLYGLGVYDSGLAIFANRRYLAAAGVRVPTVEHPWSLDEFEQALERLSALPGVSHALDMKIQYGRGEFFTYAFAPIVQSFGGDLIDRRRGRARGTLDGPRSVAAMRRLQSWFKRGWANRRPADDHEFTSGRAALSWVGHWEYARYAAALGDDLVLLPMPDFGHGPKTGMGAWAFAISSSCRNVEGAWALLRFSLRREQMLRWTAMHPGVPSRRSVLVQSPLHRAGGPLHLYVQQHERGWPVQRPSTPGYATVTAAFAGAVEAIVAGADVRAELAKAAARIDADFDAHGGYR
jgi:multiple sugar transport system substrate-binding protein